MNISIIAALGKNNVIGLNNQLPWHLTADLSYFKKMTLDKPIIMGRKTFVSIGKPLPRRKNIIVTQQKDFVAAGAIVTHSLAEALTQAEGAAEVIIVGGAKIYAEALPLAHRLYLTYIQGEFAGDTFFPPFDFTQWKEISRADYPADEKNSYAYSFVVLERR